MYRHGKTATLANQKLCCILALFIAKKVVFLFLELTKDIRHKGTDV